MQLCVDYEREIGHPAAEQDDARAAALRARLKWPARLIAIGHWSPPRGDV